MMEMALGNRCSCCVRVIKDQEIEIKLTSYEDYLASVYVLTARNSNDSIKRPVKILKNERESQSHADFAVV